MSERKKWKHNHDQAAGNAVDGGVLEKMDAFVQAEQLEVDELAHFLARGFAVQSVQSWSYFAQVNDHAKFTSSTQTLTRVIRACGEHEELVEYGVLIVKEVLTGYSKTLYRALSSLRASTTNPVIRMLNEIVIFKNGALLDDFIALFDFTLAVLPKLLIPTKTEQANVVSTKQKEHLSIRYCFIRFLINILKKSPPLLRRDFLNNNSKILTTWFKFIPVIDSDALIVLTLKTWDEFILKEQSFKKSTKLRVFNEWNLMKLVPVYYNGDKEIRDLLNGLITCVTTDSKYGIRFEPDELWFINSTSTSPIKVNGKNFRSHNKIIYGLLTNLKPWDDDVQLNTTVQILKASSELIPPYVNYLASRGLHDPKLTSYWISQTYLLSKIIRLEIPEEIVRYSGVHAPSKNTMAELIVPSVLNRSVLTKCLQSDVFLIRQLTAQLIMDSMIKLNSVLSLYNQKEWTMSKVELINSIYHRLPDLATVAHCVADSYKKQSETKILLATLLMVLNSYLSVFSDTFSFAQSISKPYMDTINQTQYSSIDLVLLDQFFKLQEGDTSQLKWWNKAGKACSLFTSLLKIASSSSQHSVVAKVSDLLINLLKQTVVINYRKVKADPVVVLVESLQSSLKNWDDMDEAEKIWKLIDESVSRCVSTPFKYLDISNAHNKISPLVIALFEQWKFVDKTTSYKRMSKWFVLFMRSLIIIGEPAADLLQLVKEVELDFDYEPYLFTNCFEASIETLSNDTSLPHDTFYGIMTTSPVNNLSKHGIPTQHIDIVGALVRIESMVVDNSISFKKVEKLFADILSTIGDYWYTHPSEAKEFSQKKYWGSLFLKHTNEKGLFISQILLEIFSQLDAFDTTDLSMEVKRLLSSEQTEQTSVVLSESLWCLNNEEVRAQLTHSDVLLKKSALQVLLERKLTLESSQLAELLTISELHSILTEFVSGDLVVFGDVTLLFESVLKDPKTFPIFTYLAKNPSLLPQLLQFVTSCNNDLLTTDVVSSLPDEVCRSHSDKETLSELFKVSKSVAIRLLQDEDFTTISFSQLSRVFSNKLSELTPDEKALIRDYALNKSSNKFSPEIPELLLAVSSFDEPEVVVWINKSVLYLTKIFAEFPEPPVHFLTFLKGFQSLILNVNVPSVLSKSHTNALLEVVFSKWTRNEDALELASSLVISSSRSSLEYVKLLQILANNDDNALLKPSPQKSKFFTSLILLRLFDFDPSKNATPSLQENILKMYSGSTRAEDLLLLKLMEKLESKLSASWIDLVYTWDFIDTADNDEELIGETRLIEKKKEGLLVILNKKFVVNGLNNYNVKRPRLEPWSHDSSANWDNVMAFYDQVSDLVSPNYSETVYDPLFLSLLIINNDELVKISAGEGEDLNVQTNIRRLVDSQLFASIVINLSSEDKTVKEVSKSILFSVLNTLKEETTTFKEKHLFELYVTKILFTIGNNTHEEIPPLVFSIITRMIPIINNPSHTLYEKVFRWILRAPFFKANEIPLYQEVTTVSTTENTDIYHNQVSWMLQILTTGIQTPQDIKLLRNKNVFEYVMNLLNSPYLPQRLRFQVLELISRVQEIEGGDILISRFGGMAHAEQTESYVSTSQKKGTDALAKEQELLNWKEIALKYGVLSQRKRLADWTQGDSQEFVKRMI
ncbi:unnamed protein product [Cyberlindnera jadinii]|uniref:Nucleolar pre-ribosomal-associated protein 1 n=1 Tax=Cyberlindnera jadinii (strain ATCC 18201 / CBS 1600 / BCRC 20928 / JCM 3617 / NBRC 0987 / NRRL Y-1542) TaxID=983966 RepID=A0A0H5C8P0_CYBJN|nr:unnamed protein product [Cyberlindnera jadinii]